jgi:TonB-linked SusC/RagA family outer membrane protein
MVKKRCLSTLFFWSLSLCTFLSFTTFAGELSRDSEVKQSQKRAITGIVRDSAEPLIGVSVAVKGTNTGTITGANGNFDIEVSQGAILVFSYLGYLTQEIKVDNQTLLNVVLETNERLLSEVVVIGYGTRIRKNVIGAVEQVDSKAFENRPITNTMQALQGMAANLIIQQKNMNPNDNNMNINIRGVGTMGNNDPLIVIDGLISEQSTFNNLNPGDIENVSILKDAGSAAIYGSRSANGVILVTTRKGNKSYKPIVRFNSLAGYERPHILFSPVKGYENAMLRNQALMNVGMTPIYTPEQIRDLQVHESEESWWLSENMKTAFQQTYGISIAGGSEATTYLVSAGYYNQGSNFVGNFGLERYNFRTNLTTEYQRLKLTSLMAYNRNAQRVVAGGTGNIIIDSSRLPAYYYYKQKEDGKYFINDVNTELNPLAHLEEGGYEKKDEDNIIGSLNLDFEIMEGLKAKGIVGIDLTQHHRYRRWMEVPLYSVSDLEKPARYLNTNRQTDDFDEKRYTLNTQFLVDFERTFNQVHQVTALLGTSNESYTRENNFIGWKFTDPDLGLPTTDDKEIDPTSHTTNAGTDKASITSLFGRAGYNYKDKYYGEFSFRYDGSSKFHKDHRWGFFPSLLAGWRISEENFMDFFKEKVGDLKVRGSYGVLGNQNVPNYSFYTVYQMYGNTYGFNNVAVPGTGYTYGNPLLTWEKSAIFNIGADISLLKNRLYLTLDYFNKTTSGILLNRETPSVFGTAAPRQNKGEMNNRGWEASLNYRLVSGEVTHNFNLNIADSKNKVTDFNGAERIDQNDQLYKLIREGVALGSYYGYKTAGFFQSYEEIANSVLPIGAFVQPGDVKYVDSYEDGVIDDKDRVVLGNAFPRYTFGFTYDIAWKGFDFRMFFQGVGKRSMYLRGELLEPFHSGYSQVIYKHQLDYWTPVNPDARWPRLTAPGSAATNNNYGKAGSDIYLLNAAYLRLKDIQLGYTIPAKLTRKIGVQKLRISMNAQNLLTLCANSFIDPESSEFGNNMGGVDGVGANSGRNYPTLIYYGIGLNVEF